MSWVMHNFTKLAKGKTFTTGNIGTDEHTNIITDSKNEKMGRNTKAFCYNCGYISNHGTYIPDQSCHTLNHCSNN